MVTWTRPEKDISSSTELQARRSVRVYDKETQPTHARDDTKLLAMNLAESRAAVSLSLIGLRGVSFHSQTLRSSPRGIPERAGEHVSLREARNYV